MRKPMLLVLFVALAAAVGIGQVSPGSSVPQNPAGTAAQENEQHSPTNQQGPQNPPTTYNENQAAPTAPAQPPAATQLPPAGDNQAPPAASTQGQPPVNQAPPAPGTLGQRSTQPQQAYPGAPIVPAGATIQATLDTPLSTKTSQVGDRFTATVAAPVNDENGHIAIPVGTKINGQVSDSEQGKTVAILRGKGRLDLRFIDMTLPNGRSAPLQASLTSVNNQKTDSEGGVQSGTSGKTAAKDVGIGAGIGTVAGLIFGSALKGLAIGAIAGGGYVLATKGKDVELPANTGLVLRLDQNVAVPANTTGR